MKKHTITIISTLSILAVVLLSFYVYNNYFAKSTQNNILLTSSNAEKVKLNRQVEKKQKLYVETENYDDITKVSIPVLMYHSINNNDPNNSLVIPPEQFKAQMQYLRDAGFTTISLDELYSSLKTGKNVPKKPVTITFDDGYVDNYKYAYPVLKDLGFKATIFMITDNVDKNPTFLTSEMLKEMSKNNISIQSHTVHHLELDKLSYDDQITELRDSKNFLDKLLNQNTDMICYPVGKFNENTIKAAETLGYKLGFTTRPGYGKLNEGPFSIHRVRIIPGDISGFKSNF